MPADYKTLSIIIPVYNERSTIDEIISKVVSVELPLEKQIIVIDDGSTDGTSNILKSWGDKEITVLHTLVNRGKGAAVRTGLKHAEGDIIVIQDADLEFDPDEYAALLAPILRDECQVVYGSRFLKYNSIPLTRRYANIFLTKFTNLLLGTTLTDMETAYKLFTQEVNSRITLRSDGFEIEPELTVRLIQAGFEICEVPITYKPRTKFEGKKIRWHDGLTAVWTLLYCRFAKTTRVEAGDACNQSE